MIKKINKQESLKYLAIVGITLLLCQNFLQMHYSSDTYVLYDLGYMEYPSKYFLLDGRIISTLVCYAAGILQIPINTYIVGMDFIGIILIGTSIYLISRMLEKMINPKNQIMKVAIIASSFVLILNQFTLEYLLFPESAVMCLGVLLNVVAIKISIEGRKNKYIKIFLVMLLAGLSYQALINIFPVLAITMYIVKQITDKREYKVKEKEFFIEMIKLAIIVLLVLAMCMCVMKIGKQILNSKQDRMMHLIDFEAIQLRGEVILGYMDELWNNNMRMLPKHTSTITLITSFVLLILLKTKKEMVMQYILLVIATFAICILPMFIFNTGICGRVNVPLMMLWGGSLIILLVQVSISEFAVRKNIVYIFVILSFVINNIFIMQNITEHIASNRVEENMGNTIKAALEKYEKETGITVTKFSYVYDLDPQQCAVGIKPIGSLTERKLACSWSILQAMNFYCERKFELIKMPISVYSDHVQQKDYTEFSEEQIIFEDDAIYLVVY